VILDEIVRWKQQELAEYKSRQPQLAVEAEAEDAPAARDFCAALRGTAGMRLIAEIKRASPSAGLIRPDFRPTEIAREYERGGAAAVSVLTDAKFFQGSFAVLRQVRQSLRLPILCKEFIIDPYQVYQARAAGADAILLIVRILSDVALSSLLEAARGLGMEALVETHGAEEIHRALAWGARVVGINNRDLDRFTVDLDTTIRLAPLARQAEVVVSESGIRTHDDVTRLQAAGVDAVLVGESLMRSRDIRRKILDLLRG